jgi:hypothetical protein
VALKIGEIFVSLGLSTASFTKNLNDAKNLAFGNSKEIERSFKIIGTAVASASVAMVSGLALLTKHAIENADKMGKLAQTTGMSVENFSALAFAAKRSDIETETLAKSMVILAKNLEKANQQTLEGKAAHSALSTLFRGNIPVFKDTHDAFAQIAIRLSQLPDGFQKSALAAQIMGKSGATLIPMLATLGQMEERARKLGAVISTETAVKAAEFNDKLKDLKTQIGAVGLGIASELLPKLLQLNQAFSESAASEFGASLGRGATVSINKVQQLFLLMRQFGEQANLQSAMARTGPDSAETAEARNALNSTRNKLNDLRLEFGHVTGAIPPLSAALKKLAGNTLDMGEANAKARQKIADFTQGLRDQIFTQTSNVIAINAYKAAQLGANATDQAAIGVLSRKLFFLHAMENLKGPKLPKIPLTMENLPSLADERMKPPEELLTDFSNLQGYAEAAAKAIKDLGLNVLKIPVKPVSELAKSMKQFAKSSAEAFGEWLIYGGSFRQMLKSIVQDLARMVFELLVIRNLMKIFGGFGGAFGGEAGTASVGISGEESFAAGGRITPRGFGGAAFRGMPFLVGEKGPELFMPDTSGTIIPNHKLGFGRGMGGGVTIVNNIDNRGADIGTTVKTAALINKMSLEQYTRMLMDRQARTA